MNYHLKIEQIYENGNCTCFCVESTNIRGVVYDLLNMSEDIARYRITDNVDNTLLFSTDKYETNYSPSIINENTFDPLNLVKDYGKDRH